MQLAGFSNWGPLSVDLAAPGVDVLSTKAYTTVFADDFETPDCPRWAIHGRDDLDDLAGLESRNGNEFEFPTVASALSRSPGSLWCGPGARCRAKRARVATRAGDCAASNARLGVCSAAHSAGGAGGVGKVSYGRVGAARSASALAASPDCAPAASPYR